MRRAFGSMTARAVLASVVALTALGGMAFAGSLPESLRTSPEEFLESVGLDLEEPGGEDGDEDGDRGDFDPAPLREGSEASEHASQTAIDVLTVVEAWRSGEFDSGCEFGQAVAAAARGDEENGDEDGFDPCDKGGSNGEEASAAGKAKGEEMSAAGKAKGQAAAEAGKAKGQAAAEAGKSKGAEASAAGKAKGGGAPGGGASNRGGGGGSGPPSNPGPPPGAGPPGGTPGGP